MHNESSHLIHFKSSSHDHFVPAMPCHQLVTQWSNGMSRISTQYPRLPPKLYLIGMNEAFEIATLLLDICTTRTIAFYDPIYSYIYLSRFWRTRYQQYLAFTSNISHLENFFPPFTCIPSFFKYSYHGSILFS